MTPMRNFLLLLITLFFLNCNNNAIKREDFVKVESLVDKQDFKSALKILNEIIKQNKDFDSAYVERAFVYLNLNELEKAIKDADEAIRINFANNSAYYVRALIYGVKQDYEKALKDYSHIINIGDSLYSPLALMERAHIHDFYGEYNKAKKDFEHLLEIDSLNILALNGKALMHSRLFEDSIAFDIYTRSILIDSLFSDTYFKRGSLLHALFNDLDGALNDLNKAISIDSSVSEYYMIRGLIYNRLNKLNYAIADLDYAIKLDPSNGYAFLNRAYIKEYSLNDLKGAEKDYSHAMKLGIEK